MDHNTTAESVERFGYNQELKRDLGFWQVFLYGVGMMFPIAPVVVFGAVTAASLGHMALAYLIAVIPMSFTAFSYGQMADAYPISGSAFAYTQRSIHPYAGFFAGWSILLDYALFPILNYIVIGVFGNMLFPFLPYWGLVITAICIITAVNILGVKCVAWVNTFLVIFMFTAVIYIVISSFTSLSGGVGWGISALPFYNPEIFKFDALLIGTSIACFSFMGFDAMTTLAEEVKHPGKTLSRATIIVCFFMAFIFILQAYCAQSVFPDWKLFESHDTAFLEAIGVAGGQALVSFVSIAVMAGAMANAIDSQAGVARVLYSMGRDEVLPKKIFTYLHPRTRVPVYSVLILAAMAVAGATQDMETIITMINFGALFAFIFVNLSVIFHYFIRQGLKKGLNFVKYLLLPSLGFLTCLTLFINLSIKAKIAGAIWLIIGFIYLAFSTGFFKRESKMIDSFNG
jgi:putrescine importer